MSILTTIFGGGLEKIIQPIGSIIDELHTSEDEKLAAKAKLNTIAVGLAEGALEYEKTVTEEQGDNIRSESTGHSWLQRNWRPILMIFFGVVIGWVIFHGAYDLDGRPIPEVFVTYVLDIVKLGISGYVVGRSAEKIVPQVVEALNQKAKT